MEASRTLRTGSVNISDVGPEMEFASNAPPDYLEGQRPFSGRGLSRQGPLVQTCYGERAAHQLPMLLRALN